MTRIRPLAVGSAAFAVVCTAVVGTAGPVGAQQKPVSGPIARYDMWADTVTGAGAMGRGAGGSAQHRPRCKPRGGLLGGGDGC